MFENHKLFVGVVGCFGNCCCWGKLSWKGGKVGGGGGGSWKDGKAGGRGGGARNGCWRWQVIGGGIGGGGGCCGKNVGGDGGDSGGERLLLFLSLLNSFLSFNLFNLFLIIKYAPGGLGAFFIRSLDISFLST